ncbi:MAG: hypothetical protein Q4D45_10520 [Lachnospiraceae bacterium]|nr:hypothetical protein [Lachnospiraceae bacterium]
MEEKLLFEKNKKRSRIRFKLYGSRIHIQVNEEKIGLDYMHELVGAVNEIELRYSYIKIPITLNLKKVKIVDKLTIVFLEALCNYIITECRRDLKVELKDGSYITSEGINSSVMLLLHDGSKNNIERFKKKYKRDLFKNHYRRIIPAQESADSSIITDVASEIVSFFNVFKVSEKAVYEVVSLVAELAGNVKEHTNSDCIIDIDVTPSKYSKKGEKSNTSYYGINIAIVNFSEVLLGTQLKSLFSREKNLDGRYKKVQDAYEYHKKFFNEEYGEEDFFNITAFQNKISGRDIIASTGGTGLTKTIESLEKRADAHHCYVISGNRGIRFDQDYLEYHDGWIGFNSQNDYFANVPDLSLLISSKLYIPGTAYNLNLVMKKED